MTISGKDLDGELSSVKFGNAVADIASVEGDATSNGSASVVRVFVPEGATSGPIKLTYSDNKTLTSSSSFTVESLDPAGYQVLAVTGYNVDVVANGTNAPVTTVTTSQFDHQGYYLMELAYNNGISTAQRGLPPGGFIASASTSGLAFQLASYAANNSLRLTNGTSGTLTLSQPQALSTVHLLAAATGGRATMDVTVRYTDNSGESFTGRGVTDWFERGSGATITGLGRVTPSGSIDNNSTFPILYQYTLPLSPANKAKLVSSIAFTQTSGTVLNVMGVSGNISSDLVISDEQDIPAGAYRNITIRAGGLGRLLGDISVSGALLIEDGGALYTITGSSSNSCQRITGAGTFTLAAGGYLEICDAQGIALTGPTGTIQSTGPRSFSADARYDYTSDVAQTTGDGLPATVRELLSYNASDVTLRQPLAIRQLLDLEAAGNLQLAGQPLTLLSDESGTALVVNFGTGKVLGNSAIVQRYLDAALSPGLGYRH